MPFYLREMLAVFAHLLFRSENREEIVITVLQDIRDEFLTHIGIPNMSERKKERINLVDSERNTVETAAKVSLWLEELQAGIDSAIKLFPELSGKIAVSLTFLPDLSMKGGVADVDG